MTKEFIKESYSRIRTRLGHQPSKAEFTDQSSISDYYITKYFRTFSDLVREMGDVPKSFSIDPINESELMTSYGNTIKRLNKIPTNAEWLYNDCKPVLSVYIERYKLRKFADMASEFYKYARELKEWSDIIDIARPKNNSVSEFPESTTEECYVYLMLDSKTKLYKIGLSNAPGWREKTLQSEKPSIKLIVAKKFINRRMASIIEKGFHGTYSHKNRRGEWFQLDDEDVYEIKVTLGDSNK